MGSDANRLACQLGFAWRSAARSGIYDQGNQFAIIRDLHAEALVILGHALRPRASKAPSRALQQARPVVRDAIQLLAAIANRQVADIVNELSDAEDVGNVAVAENVQPKHEMTTNATFQEKCQGSEQHGGDHHSVLLPLLEDHQYDEELPSFAWNAEAPCFVPYAGAKGNSHEETENGKDEDAFSPPVPPKGTCTFALHAEASVDLAKDTSHDDSCDSDQRSQAVPGSAENENNANLLGAEQDQSEEDEESEEDEDDAMLLDGLEAYTSPGGEFGWLVD